MIYSCFVVSFIFLLSGGFSQTDEITEDDFRCKGDSAANPPCLWKGELYYDGDGGTLPQRGIDEDLLILLNVIQFETGRKVVVLSGYRSRMHNSYLAAELFNYVNDGDSGNPYEVSMTSKHLMGAAADFYVEGFEDKHDEILEVIFEAIKKTGDTSSPVSSFVYLRPRMPDGERVRYFFPSYRTDRWWIHAYAENEGRDIDCRLYEGIYFHINKRLTFSPDGCFPVK